MKVFKNYLIKVSILFDFTVFLKKRQQMRQGTVTEKNKKRRKKKEEEEKGKEKNKKKRRKKLDYITIAISHKSHVLNSIPCILYK